jgi:hypothetical protein
VDEIGGDELGCERRDYVREENEAFGNIWSD